jgi:hypothetical protein
MEHDFREFYEICGSVMQSKIEEMITKDKHPIKRRLNAYINACIQYLLSLNDDDFRNKYIELYHIDTETGAEFIIDDIDEDEEDDTKFEERDIMIHNRYNKYDHAFACVSNIALIRRCLSISKIPLNVAIKEVTSIGTQLFINFDLESCKLLHEAGIDLGNLLFIARTVHNYDSIMYILQHMTELNLGDLIMDQRLTFMYVSNIYIVDKIQEHPDDCLKVLMKQEHMTYNIHDRSNNIVIKCYYIIKYMPREEGIIYLKNANEYYDAQILKYKKSKSRDKTAICTENKKLYNQLLEFHFKPRGTHTKSALTF